MFSIHTGVMPSARPHRRAAAPLAAVLALCAALPATAVPAAAQDAPAAADARGQAVERGRALARALVGGDSVPGLSVAVGIGGEVVWAEGFGWADVEQRRPVTTETQFRAGSVGKTLTSAAAALLHQRGRLDLDAPVRSYVPEFPEKPWPVTTRQLLGHVGGIRGYATRFEALRAQRCEDVRDGLDVFAADTLVAAPGTRFTYTSYGYALASAAVQAAAGEPFAAFVQREILTPLGMGRTLPEPTGELPDRATPYLRSAGTLVPAPYDDDSCVLGGGGFLSTPSDLVRFGFGMMDGALHAPETVRMVWTPMQLQSGESTGYGMGWFVRAVPLVRDAPPAPMYGHGGSSVGGTTSFMVFPGPRIVVAVTTNVSDVEVAPLAATLAQVFRPLAGP